MHSKADNDLGTHTHIHNLLSAFRYKKLDLRITENCCIKIISLKKTIEKKGTGYFVHEKNTDFLL